MDRAALLVAALEAGDEALEEYDPGQEECLELLDALAHRARSGHSTHTLLRALLRVRCLWLGAARRTVELVRQGTLMGRAAFLCVSELRMSVLGAPSAREPQPDPERTGGAPGGPRMRASIAGWP